MRNLVFDTLNISISYPILFSILIGIRSRRDELNLTEKFGDLFTTITSTLVDTGRESLWLLAEIHSHPLCTQVVMHVKWAPVLAVVAHT